MGIGAILGGLGSAIGLGSEVAGLASGGSPANQTQGGNPATFIPPNQKQAASDYQQLFGAQVPQALSLPGQVLPGLQQYTSNLQNNPYAAQQLAGSQQVAAAGPGVAGQQFGGASTLYGLGGTAAGLAPQIIQSAFDPQRALYDQQFQQMRDQTNAINSMSGVAGSPYAAGLASEAAQNFNTNWENQQLQRQIAGVQGLGALSTAAGRDFTVASDLGTGGLATLLSSSGSPYTTYAGQQGADIAALQSLISGSSAIPGTGAYGNISSAYSPLQSYLNLGQGASALAQAGQAQNFGQQQIIGAGLANTLANPSLSSSLSALFSPTNASINSGFDYTNNPGLYPDPVDPAQYGQYFG